MRAFSFRRAALAAVAALALAAPAAADSVSIRNCANQPVDVRVYDNNPPPNRTLRATTLDLAQQTTWEATCTTPLCWITVQWGGGSAATARSGLVCTVSSSSLIAFGIPPCSC